MRVRAGSMISALGMVPKLGKKDPCFGITNMAGWSQELLKPCLAAHLG